MGCDGRIADPSQVARKEIWPSVGWRDQKREKRQNLIRYSWVWNDQHSTFEYLWQLAQRFRPYGGCFSGSTPAGQAGETIGRWASRPIGPVLACADAQPAMDPLCLCQLTERIEIFQLGYTMGERERTKNVIKYLRGCAGGWAQSGPVCVESCA